MKRASLSLCLLSLGILATSGLTGAQERRAAPRKKAAASSVGLIDMAHVFQNYEKFKERQAALKSEVLQSDEEAKKRRKNLLPRGTVFGNAPNSMLRAATSMKMSNGNCSMSRASWKLGANLGSAVWRVRKQKC